MIGKMIAAVVAVAGVTAGVGIVTTTASSDDAVVTRIVDGDTFEATVAGAATTIRLLNIDTPETKDPNADVECLGPEAAARLAELLPVGSAVDLSYDQERTDGYGRTLAGVQDAEGLFVNAELAREGLGTAVVVGDNDRFYDEVLAAQDEARASGRGLYSPTVTCTLPARVEEATAAVAQEQQTAAQPPSDPAELDRAARRAVDLGERISILQGAFGGSRTGLVWTALAPEDERRLTDRLAGARADAETLRVRWTELADGAREQLRLEAERVEQDRVAAAERERVAAAERERAAAAERERDAAAARQAGTTAAPPAVTAPAAAGSTGGGCDPNYTPCVPISAKDLDCSDLPGGPYRVVGSDPHRLDNDDPDNLGCEGNG